MMTLKTTVALCLTLALAAGCSSDSGQRAAERERDEARAELAMVEAQRDTARASLQTAMTEISRLEAALDAVGDASDAEIARLTRALDAATRARDAALSRLREANDMIADLEMEQTQPAPRHLPLADAMDVLLGASHSIVLNAASTVPTLDPITQASSKSDDGMSAVGAGAYLWGNSSQLWVDMDDPVLTRFDRVAREFIPATALFEQRRVDTLIGYDGDTTVLAKVVIDWDGDGSSAWLTSGYWLRAAGDLDGGVVTSDGGAFVNGAELSDSVTLPVDGTATYRGPAIARYVSTLGADAAERYGGVPGARDSGEMTATATLTADFGAGTINGCIGCEGTTTFEADVVLPDGTKARFGPIPAPQEIQLGEAVLDATGSFTGEGVEVQSPEIVSQSGAWGGRFSNVMQNGVPRLAAGTFGVEVTEQHGGTGAFIGTFVAGAE